MVQGRNDDDELHKLHTTYSCGSFLSVTYKHVALDNTPDTIQYPRASEKSLLMNLAD